MVWLLIIVLIVVCLILVEKLNTIIHQLQILVNHARGLGD